MSSIPIAALTACWALPLSLATRPQDISQWFGVWLLSIGLAVLTNWVHDISEAMR